MTKRVVSRQKYSPRYHTVAHEFLELKQLPGIETLDLILEEAASTISRREYSETEVPAVIENIEKILTRDSVVKRGGIPYVNSARRKQELYSNAGPVVCMAIAEVLNLPYAAVKDSQVIISWNFPYGNYVNQVILSQNHDQEEFEVVSENDNVDRLDKNQSLARYYTNIGKWWVNKGKLKKALDCFDKAIELNPASVKNYH